MENQYYSKEIKNNYKCDSITNTEGGKSSNSVTLIKKELSPKTIISSIEREISQLIQETNIRSQKNKLISIQETLKILSKKLFNHTKSESMNQGGTKEITYEPYDHKKDSYSAIQSNYASNSKNIEDIMKSKEESEALNKFYENEIKEINEKLKNTGIENFYNNNLNALKNYSENENKILKKDEILIKLDQRIDQLTSLIQEEKNKNNEYVLQIKNLENNLKSLSNEYNTLNNKHLRLQNECEIAEKTINDIKKNSNDNRNKFDELIKINSELKTKFIESENTLKLHNEDLKSLLKKISSQQKIIEDLENKNKILNAELSYKEERLKSLRMMNSKLENKSKLILKKFENIKFFEERTNEVNSNNQKMMEVIEELNTKYKNQIADTEKFRQTVDDLSQENSNIKNELEDNRKQLILMKNLNDDLNSKNAELEKKFKAFLESKDNLNTSNSNMNKKQIANSNISGTSSSYRSLNNQQVKIINKLNSFRK
jgi:chromosome segregation ATPase